MENFQINHLAVVLSAMMSLVIGALWYSPVLFERQWQNAAGISDEQLKMANPLKIFGITFLLALLMSYNLAFFLGSPGTTWRWGLAAGLLTGIGGVAAMFTVISLFEHRSIKYIAINSGYIIVYFAVIGIIIGAWR